MTHDEGVIEGGSENEDGVRIELARAGRSSVAARAPAREKVDDDFDADLEGQLTVDVYQTPSEIVVESAVAGVAPEDLDINISQDKITITGRRHREKEIKEHQYFYQECYWGRFSRSIMLPQDIDPDKAFATFKNGILAVHLPKANRQKTKKLKVLLE